MNFSNFTKTSSGNLIYFKNESPIENVGSIKFYTDNSSKIFSKKEFRWSFDKNYWSSWMDLNIGNININTKNNPYLFLEIKYTMSSPTAGKVSLFSIEYILSSGQIPIPIKIVEKTPVLSKSYENLVIPEKKLIVVQAPISVPKANNSIFTKTSTGNIIYFKNESPLINVGTIKLYRDNASGNFIKKEFKWAFDRTHWSSWMDLNIGNLTKLVVGDHKYLFLEIRYTMSSPTSGQVSLFSIDYLLNQGKTYAPAVEDVKVDHSHIISDGCNDLGGVVKTFEVIKVTDAEFLCGKDCEYYLWRPNQKGEQAITTITGLQQALNNIISNSGAYGLSLRDVSIAWLASRNYLKESSLNLESGFAWGLNGQLYIDVSVVAGGVTKIYVDDSLFLRDVSIANLDSRLGLLAPAKPNLLTDKTLLLSNSVLYSARLPLGLTGAWYYNSSSGNIIYDYSVNDTFRLTTPSFSDTFRAGYLNNINTSGILTGYINGILVASYDMSAGFGNTTFSIAEASGFLRYNDASGYGGINSDFWRRAEAYIDISSQEAGGVKYSIGHSEALTSNEFFLRFDPSPGVAKWSVSPSASEGALNIVFLSGLEYYGLNSKILVSFTAESGIFENAYHSVAVGKITSAYGSQILLNPVAIPNFNDIFAVTNQQFTFDIANQITGSSYPTLAVTLYKPNFTGDSSILILSKRLNTYSPTRATVTAEYFTDESKRLLAASSSSDTPWISSDYAIFNPDNGAHAQVQNGTLRYPVSTDYAGFAFTGTNKQYLRRFTKTGTSSNGILTFNGFNPITDSSAYGFGNTNIILWLTDQNKYYDLALEFGTGGDGSSISSAKGAWSTRSSSSITWSLGTDSLGNETTHINQFALIIIFRNTSKSMTQITLS